MFFFHDIYLFIVAFILSCYLSNNYSPCCVKSVKIWSSSLTPIFLYSEWTRENTDQKKLRIWILFTQCYASRNQCLCGNIRGTFRAQLNISKWFFCDNNWQLNVVNYFCKSLHLRCWLGSEYASEHVKQVKFLWWSK